MRRVLIVATLGLRYEGITSVIWSYVSHMDRTGLDLHFVSCCPVEEALRRDFETVGTVYEIVNRKKRPFCYVRQLSAIMKGGFDVVHVHGNSGTMALEMVLARRFRIPLKIVHGHSSRCSHPILNRGLRACMIRLSDVRLACSKAAGGFLYPGATYQILSNAIELGRFAYDEGERLALRRELGIEGFWVVGHVGNFEFWKNHGFLLDIFREIRKTGHPAKLLLVGDGPLRPSMEEKADRLGIRDDVVFCGRRRDPERFYQAMDVVAVPSLWEGLSMVAVEAQAAGLPVVASDAVPREVDATRSVTFLSLDRGAACWAECIMEALSHERERKGAYERLSEGRYDIMAEAGRLSRIYRAGLFNPCRPCDLRRTEQMRGKKVLFISRHFAPSNKIAAVRTTKLVKYLRKSCGCEVTVITGKNNIGKLDPVLRRDLRTINSVYRVPFGFVMKAAERWIHGTGRGNGLRQSVDANVKASRQKGKKTAKDTISSVLAQLYWLMADWSFASQGKRLLRRLKASGRHYDVILTSYGPYSSNWIGGRAKKLWPDAKWIAEFRDPIITILTPALTRFLTRPHSWYYVRKPDMVVGISHGGLEALHVPKGKRTAVVTNGYDREDWARETAGCEAKDRCLRIAYCGTLVGSVQDPSPLFQVIQSLMSGHEISKEDILIEYAGPSSHDFHAKITEYGLDPIFVDHGMLPRDESLKMQSRADILLLVIWNRPDAQGAVSGKFYEYMMMGKPICCIVNGTSPDSETGRMMEEGKLGLCYEEAAGDGVGKLEGFIRQCLREKKEGAIIHHPNLTYIEQFSYDNIARAYRKLFD